MAKPTTQGKPSQKGGFHPPYGTIDAFPLADYNSLASLVTRHREQGGSLIEHSTAEVARQLEEIYKRIDGCKHCDLGKHNIPPRLRYKAGTEAILVVSQNPGTRKDPTCNHVWGGLDVLFKQVNRVQELADKVWITNIVKCRTEDNARPTAAQIKACEGWLEQEIAALRPKLIIGLGNPARRWLELKGLSFSGDYHPSFVRRRRRSYVEEYVERLARLIPSQYP